MLMADSIWIKKMNLNVKFQMNKKEWIQAHEIDVKRLYLSMALVILVFLIIAAATQQPLRSVIMILGASIIIVIIFMFINHLILLAEFKKFPLKEETINWKITNQGVMIDSVNNYNTKTGWDKIFRIVENKRGFMFVTKSREFSWLPKIAFQKEEDLEKFIALSKSKVQKYKYTRL